MGYRTSGDIIKDLIYPRRCPVCHGLAPWGRDICPDCMGKLPYIETGRCRKCGKPVEDSKEFCEDCLAREHFYDEGIGVLRYDEVMRSTISWFKFKGRQEYARPLGRVAWSLARDRLDIWKPDILVPIPVHKTRRAERGFNQAELLARVISDCSGIPWSRDWLERSGKTAAMKNLNPEERFLNLRNALKTGPSFEPGRRILLIDDIYTTGATIDAAAHVLKSHGSGMIFFLTICIGQGFMVQY